MHRKVKPHPAMFVQNAAIDLTLTAENSELWIENSYIGKNWKLDNRHIITGVPANNWELDLPPVFVSMSFRSVSKTGLHVLMVL